MTTLNDMLQEIAIMRTALSDMDYSDPKYDEVEEKLHVLEDNFHSQHGEYMRDVLRKIHDQYCPDTELLHSTAYIAKVYTVNDKNEFSVNPAEGIWVEVDEFPNRESRLVMIPNPPRMVLSTAGEKPKLVWSEKA